MFCYFFLTALLNIAIGFAIAVYLRRRSEQMLGNAVDEELPFDYASTATTGDLFDQPEQGEEPVYPEGTREFADVADP